MRSPLKNLMVFSAPKNVPQQGPYGFQGPQEPAGGLEVQAPSDDAVAADAVAHRETQVLAAFLAPFGWR